MDNIESWSTFDAQVQNAAQNNESTSSNGENGLDSLYLSQTSQNLSPAAAALMRKAGLTFSPQGTSNNANDNSMTETESEDEFRLRFHWMRPHPSVVFSIEEEMAEKRRQEGKQTLQTDDNGTIQQKKIAHSAPAVTASKMMRVYRDAKIKQLNVEECSKPLSDDGEAICRQSDSDSAQEVNDSNENNTINLLPFECPELRIDLTSLVDPPLMTSWLPSAERPDVSYSNE